MTSWKQRLAVGYIVGLFVVALVAAAAFPAKNVGERFLHALLAVCAVGVVALIVLFVLMFALAARESQFSSDRSAKR